MRVKLKSTRAGPEGINFPGEVIDLPEDEAHWLVRRGAAQFLNGVPSVTVIETAALVVPETRKRVRG